MLYGHVEDTAARVHHLIELRKLQDETQGFQVFIPLAFQPENNELGITKHTFGADDLKTIAISRLMLDNFQNIKAYWVMTSPAIAQLALHYGANDIDGTVIDEKIANMAGSTSGKGLTQQNLMALIQQAGCEAVERTTTYEPIAHWPYQLGPRETPVEARELEPQGAKDPLHTPPVTFVVGPRPEEWTQVPWEATGGATLPPALDLSEPKTLCLYLPAGTPTVYALRALGRLSTRYPEHTVGLEGPGLTLKLASLAPHYGARALVLPGDTDPTLAQRLFENSGTRPSPWAPHHAFQGGQTPLTAAVG